MLPGVEGADACRELGEEQEVGGLRAACEVKALIDEPCRRVPVRSHQIEAEEAEQHREEGRGVAERFADLTGAGEVAKHLRSRISLRRNQGHAEQCAHPELLPVARGARRNPIESREPLAQMAHRFDVGRVLDGALARLLPVPDRLLGESGLREMVGELLGLLLGRIGEARLEGLRDLPVELLAAPLEERLVGRLLDQRMLEDVAGMRHRPTLVEQLRLDQTLESAPKRGLIQQADRLRGPRSGTPYPRSRPAVRPPSPGSSRRAAP